MADLNFLETTTFEASRLTKFTPYYMPKTY